MYFLLCVIDLGTLSHLGWIKLMLSIVDVDKSYGSQRVLTSVSLQLGGGEFFSILGPSGCGKSTLLRILAGFECPDQGRVMLNGGNITDVAPHSRPMNMVFQRYALFPHMNVAENVGFSLRIKKVEPAERRRLVDEALNLVAMASFADRPIDKLSGGQQQRVALARAIVSRPKVLLLDEPLSALDLQLRLHMQAELRSLQRRLGMTFVFVTHDQSEALAMSDRLAVMNQGRIVQVGTPSEVYEQPDNAFVATFLGSMNCLAGQYMGRVDGRRQHGWVDLGEGQHCAVRLSETTAVIPVGAQVQVFVRPEKIRLSAVGNLPTQSASLGHEDNELPALMTDVAYRGATVEFCAKLAMQSAPVSAIMLNGDFASARPKVGAKIKLGFAADDAWILSGGALV